MLSRFVGTAKTSTRGSLRGFSAADPWRIVASKADRQHPAQLTLDEITNNPNLPKRIVPIQLRYSGDQLYGNGGGEEGTGHRLLVDTRIRKGPYFHLSQEEGVRCFTVYNRTYHPRSYTAAADGGLFKEYDALTKGVTMWNVAVERQIQVKGPDAVKFVDYVITRKAEACKVMRARYVILCNYNGGVLNDPIMLRPAEDEYWFSLSDSDIGLYLQGVNCDGRFNVTVEEIDVSPVQIQGPKSTEFMRSVVGPVIDEVPYYGLLDAEINGTKTIISRTGWSTERGYEIYLRDSMRDAESMWYHLKEKGKPFDLRVIAPGHHRRIEAGILSWGGDIDQEVNPYQCGLGWMVDESKEDFIGKAALAKIKAAGITHKLAGLRIHGGQPITWYTADFYHIRDRKTGDLVGYVTSGWYSPEQQTNIALAMLPVDYATVDMQVDVVLPDIYKDPKLGHTVPATVCTTPFKMPDKDERGTGLNTTGSKL